MSPCKCQFLQRGSEKSLSNDFLRVWGQVKVNANKLNLVNANKLPVKGQLFQKAFTCKYVLKSYIRI